METGMCLARRECEHMSFNEGDCRRANSLYSIGGLLCRNGESVQTNCENTTTIFAVNINGQTHTDKRGIVYMADNDAFYEDKYNTRMDEDQIIDEIQDADKKLYDSYSFGEGKGSEKGQCLRYSIKVEQDGEYELALRTVEPKYRLTGRRIFSLTLNQVPIVDHVDLAALSGRLSPVEIIANLTIETSVDGVEIRRFITIKGYRVEDFYSYIRVGLCISDCRLCEEYNYIDPGYVGSGISLTRL